MPVIRVFFQNGNSKTWNLSPNAADYAAQVIQQIWKDDQPPKPEKES